MTGDSSFAESLRSVGAGEECVSPPLVSRETEKKEMVSKISESKFLRVAALEAKE